MFDNEIRMRDTTNLYTSVEIHEDDLHSNDHIANNYPTSPRANYSFKVEEDNKFKFNYTYLKKYARDHWSSIFPILIFIFINAFIVLMFIIFHKQILNWMQDLGNYLKTLGFVGMLIPIALIIIASFPPIPGYGTVSVLCGFVYDFPMGFIPPFVGGILGATSCFLVSRKYGQSYIRKLLAHYTYIKAAMKAIEIKGAKLLFLVRVAPYPWTIMNFVLGATKISYTKFIFATALSLPKLLLHVYLGSSAKSLLESGAGSPTKIVMLVFALVTFVGVTIYLYFTCKKIINNTLDDPDYRIEDNDDSSRHNL